MGRKDYLLQLCASNDIETSKKDTMATLTAKLESAGIPTDVPSGSHTTEARPLLPTEENTAATAPAVQMDHANIAAIVTAVIQALDAKANTSPQNPRKRKSATTANTTLDDDDEVPRSKRRKAATATSSHQVDDFTVTSRGPVPPRSHKNVTALGSPRGDIGGESAPPDPHSHKRTTEVETDSNFSDQSDATILLGTVGDSAEGPHFHRNGIINEIYRLGQADSTKRTYRQGLIAYNNFLHKSRIEPTSTISHKMLLCFISYLALDLRLAFNTISVYINAVRSWAIDSHVRDPLNINSDKKRRYKKFIAGIRRYTKSRKQQRRPLKKRELKRVINALPLCGYSHRDLVTIKSAILLAFYGFLRVSEYTSTRHNGSTCLSRRDVKFIRDTGSSTATRVKLRLRRTKTSQFESDTYVDIFANGSDLCPVKSLSDYYQFYKESKKNSPLFVLSSGLPLTPVKFNYMLRSSLQAASLDPKRYSSHSLRSGGATVAANHGVPSWVIQKMGRWKSDCYKLYIKNIQSNVKYAQKVMAL